MTEDNHGTCEEPLVFSGGTEERSPAVSVRREGQRRGREQKLEGELSPLVVGVWEGTQSKPCLGKGCGTEAQGSSLWGWTGELPLV